MKKEYVTKENLSQDVKLNMIDYKDKHFCYQDADIVIDEAWDYIIGTTTKQEILKDKDGIQAYMANCDQYGVSPYHGNNKELNKIFTKLIEVGPL